MLGCVLERFDKTRTSIFPNRDRSAMAQNTGLEHWSSGVSVRQASQQGSVQVSGQRVVQKENHSQRQYGGQPANNSAYVLKKATSSLLSPSHVADAGSLASDLGSCSLKEETRCKNPDASIVNFERNSRLYVQDKDSSDGFSPTRSKQNGDSSSIISRFELMNRKSTIQHIELLYQEYCEKSTFQEIQTRRMQDTGEFTNEDKPPKVDTGTITAAAKQPDNLNQRTNGQGMNLWQYTEKVRNSKILSSLSPNEIKLQELMFELCTSEASYYKSLGILISHFMESQKLNSMLSGTDKHHIFSNILEIKAASERFLQSLEQRFEENIVINDVCDIVYEHTNNYFHVYISYVTNQSYQETAYRRAIENNPALSTVMAELEQDPKCKGLLFPSFIILPFQRITRLKLLVQNILKKAKEGSVMELTSIKAHRELEKIIKECNERVKKMRRTEDLISFEKTVTFKVEAVPIITRCRWLLKEGEVEHMSGRRKTRTFRTKKLFTPVYLFLFNDLFLITKKISDKYQVFDHARRGLLRTQDLEDQGQTLANMFTLRILENYREKEIQYMLRAKSVTEKKRWIKVLEPNPRMKYLSPSSLHEDCAQVQCIQRYAARQPDELTLEPADILSVVDSTPDGWIFGERLHDRERGWFPNSMTEDIKNPELRAQNRMECYRVYKAEECHGSKYKDWKKSANRIIH
ncbi:ephexin-1 isoform X2 [Callorhinchus milii]|uniref:ephexin-1 isoform X2 n=1 Tax=Callorhinchus milii TaxID=7868 RepID=UPI001C3F5292|nr:ephexin-1 isoform X2 [Callorhinchus milii]